jgi:hypothetical protein
MDTRQKPRWIDIKKEEYDRLTDEVMAELKADNERFDAEGREWDKGQRGKATEVVKMAVEVWGKNSRQVKYLERQWAPVSVVYSFSTFENTVKGIRDKAVKEEREKEMEAHRKNLTKEAIKWLEERDKKLFVDFDIDEAISYADQLSLDEEVLRKQKMEEMWDCGCDECGKWDGKSNRCNCGNRRVYWASDMHGFQEPHIYPEVY